MKILALASTSVAALFAAGAAMAAPPLLTPAESWMSPPISNVSYVEQIGDFHDATVDQSGAGTATSLIIQGRNSGNDDDNDANVDQRNSTGAVSYVVQFDDHNDATVVQRGVNQTSGIVQRGERNQATVTQTGTAATSASSLAPGVLDPNGGLRTAAGTAISLINSTVHDPVATYSSLHAFNGAALILQVGDRNEGAITQSGSENTAVIESFGDRNGATITQTGIHDDAFVLQHGNRNDATVTQNAYGDVALVFQDGFNNDATVVQNSNYAFSVQHQVGSMNSANVTQ